MQYRTPEEAKQWLLNQGYSLKGWAKANNFSYQNVSRVLNSDSKMLFGESRKIAQTLNIKVPE